MLLITLENQANQCFNLYAGGINWEITLKHNPAGFTMASIKADNKELCQNTKCFANQNILPYFWQSQKGNFIFVTENEEYPVFENYGKTCFLYFLEPGEAYANANN